MMRLTYISLYRLRQLVRSKRSSTDVVAVRSLSGERTYTYSRARLHEHRAKLAILLSQLPDTLKQTTGSPDYWMRARLDWQGNTWATTLDDADELLAMGRAIGYVSVSYPQGESPCDMPCVLVLDRDAAATERQLPLPERHRRLSFWSFDYLRQSYTHQ